tara:strand:+ start:440 stop:781 length:342 start_codon:yes stop_codon:yes gene_type:complete
MKFDIKSLEDKLNNISNISNNSKIITNNIKNLANKKQIELILYVFFFIFNYYYHKRKNEYLEQISYFSSNYLLGSDWYIGEDFTYEDFYNELEQDVKLKISSILFIYSYLYNL